jgi:serine/threonine-protein kinase
MARFRFPAGDTTASRLKALALWVQRQRGLAERDEMLAELKIDAEYLADETRPLSVRTWHEALQTFSTRFGRGALPGIWSTIVDAENLAVWTRVLKGASRPEQALAQLDALGGDERQTCRWETSLCRPGRWRGRVLLGHDPEFERDGLWALARGAELAAVPAMFGLGPGTVTIGEFVPPEASAPEPEGSQQYELTWRVPTPLPAVLLAVGGLLVGAPFALAQSGSSAVVLGGAGALVGAAVGRGWYVRKRQAADTAAQMTRIRALERSVSLKEQREKAGVGFVPGAVFAGRYRLGRKLGSGASGVIHEAVRLSDNQPVAIKLLRAAVASDMLASDRLRRESEALGLTWHPNVVEIHEYDHLPDGTAYLVMELLRGESLAARLRRQGPLTVGQLGPIAVQMCDALGAVHAAGVIHRDVKPSNIYLALTDAEIERVKLLDFGIARVEWAETRLTNGGSPVGTPGYMSPEQEHGEDIDPRSDLYGLGAVLYECLIGTPPPIPVSGRYSIPPGSATSSADDPALFHLPPEWIRLIRCAMAPMPNERFADARAMREAIVALVPDRSGEYVARTPVPDPRKARH